MEASVICKTPQSARNDIISSDLFFLPLLMLYCGLELKSWKYLQRRSPI